MRSTLSLCKDYIRSPPYYLQCSSFLASTSYISRQPSYIIIFHVHFLLILFLSLFPVSSDARRAFYITGANFSAISKNSIGV